MSGGKNLQVLLHSMKPEIGADVFVFCSLSAQMGIPLGIDPILIFKEPEGVTLVLRREEAETIGLTYQYPSRKITLTVHSSLDAIGFLAAITARLAEAGISVNAVSAFYHDHLFVPDGKAEEAMRILYDFSRPSPLS